MIEKVCSKHGFTTHYLVKNGNKVYSRCSKCRTEHVTEWRRKLKLKLVNLFGGKCKLCGYNKCIQALQFHHINPESKNFSISQFGNCRRFDKCVEEAKKCILLCANCHAEIENGISYLC